MPTADDIKRALSRIRAMMPREKVVDRSRRDIRLGLERINRVVTNEQGWTGIHVAGTNGKGAICALLANMLRRNGLSHGVFVSPALPEPHNGILINGRFVNKHTYESDLADLQKAYRRAVSAWTFTTGEDAGDLTPFEAQTATAFRLFNRMRVQYGIVETGMGGGTDATNAMRQKALTIISKIDLDHQGYLGNTIEKIAKVKAGIMRPRVPCVVDHTNPEAAQRVLFEHALKVGARIHLSSEVAPLLEEIDQEKVQLEEYEKENLLCATLAFRLLFPSVNLDLNRVVGATPSLPGRKDTVKVTELTQGARQNPIIVDGAHNALGAATLARYVRRKVREDNQPVTWILGFSSGKLKPIAKIIETLVQPQDNVAFVQYKQEFNDPEPVHFDLGRDIVKDLLRDASQLYGRSPSVEPAIQWACGKAGEGPIILTGSLYLIRDFYRLEGVRPWLTIGTMRPGLAQLMQYNKLARERELTPEEEAEFKRARRHRRLNPKINPVFRTDEAGGNSIPKEVPEHIRELQRTAAHHRKQANAYRVAIEGLKNDALKAPNNDGSRKVQSNGSAEFSQSLEVLEKRLREHLDTHEIAMHEIRQYFNENDPRESADTRPRAHRSPAEGRVAALMREHGLEEAMHKRSESNRLATARGTQDTANTKNKALDEFRFWGEFEKRRTENREKDVGGEDDDGHRRWSGDSLQQNQSRGAKNNDEDDDVVQDQDGNEGDEAAPQQESRFRHDR